MFGNVKRNMILLFISVIMFAFAAAERSKNRPLTPVTVHRPRIRTKPVSSLWKLWN